MECEHWLTDEHGIVGRCSRTKTQTSLNCSCDPDPVKQNYLTRKIVTHLVVEDHENGETWEFGTIKDVAEVLDIGYSKLRKMLQKHTTVHHKQYSITKQNNTSNMNTDKEYCTARYDGDKPTYCKYRKTCKRYVEYTLLLKKGREMIWLCEPIACRESGYGHYVEQKKRRRNEQ